MCSHGRRSRFHTWPYVVQSSDCRPVHHLVCSGLRWLPEMPLPLLIIDACNKQTATDLYDEIILLWKRLKPIEVPINYSYVLIKVSPHCMNIRLLRCKNSTENGFAFNHQSKWSTHLKIDVVRGWAVNQLWPKNSAYIGKRTDQSQVDSGRAARVCIGVWSS